MMRLVFAAALALSLTACAQQPPAAATPGIRTSGTAAHPDTTRNAVLFAGGDIGERINAALADCKQRCTVRVPAGDYNFATTIRVPLNGNGAYMLDIDPGAMLKYTGAGDAILAPATGGGRAELLITGGQLIGNPKAQSGIHTLTPANKITIRNMTIVAFSNGDAIHIDGTNSALILDNDITYNGVGIHLTGTRCSNARDAQGDILCAHNNPGPGYAPNAIHVIGNMIVDNVHWGVWEEWAPGVTPALNNLYLGNNMEHNGHEPNGGAMWLAYSFATQVISNYFEASPHYIYVGDTRQAPAVGVSVRGNYFTSDPNQPISVNLIHAQDTMIEDNSQLGFPNNPAPCFVDLGQETGTFLGKNHVQARSTVCRGGKPATISPRAYASAPSIGQFVGQITTTAASADTLAIPGLTAQGHCAASAANAPAAALGGIWVEAGANAMVLHHAAQAGAKLNVFCSFE